MTAITITIPGDCVPWARTMGGRATPRFKPKKQADYTALVKMIAKAEMLGRPPRTGALAMRLAFFYSWPTSFSEKKRTTEGERWKATRPDLDNLIKQIKDALNGIVYVDDAQIAMLSATKSYHDQPGVTIFVASATGEVWQ